VRDPGPAVVWPAAAPVPDAGNRRIPARQPAPQTGPAPQAGNVTGTDAIVDLLAPPSARDAAATVPAPRPARR
jgi:hypothetical protein